MADLFEEIMKGDTNLGDVGSMQSDAVRKTLLVVFVVDNSGSMSGDRIYKVNEAFKKMIPSLQDIQLKVADAYELRIAIMTFGREPKWIVAPTRVMEYTHDEIVADGGSTEYGKMLESLESKLTRKEFIPSKGKIAEPYIMLMTDGEPTDKDYNTRFESLNQNSWYARANRYAVLIGKKAIESARARAAVEAFVKSPDDIINAAKATEIVKAVSAHTIIAVENMTNRKRAGDNYDEILKGGSNYDISGDWGNNWAFPDTNIGMDANNPF